MGNLKRAAIAVAMAASLTGAQAMAAESSLLAPGKPAGVEQAQHSSRLLLIAGAVTVAVIAVVIATATTSNSECGTACTTPTTTS